MVTSKSLDVIFERTERALQKQQDIPLSPGRVCASGQLLCAGAMLVHEALAVLRSPAEARSFAERVVNEDTSFIEDTGEKIGLDRMMVVQTKHLNDSLGNSDRLSGVLRSLRSLRYYGITGTPKLREYNT